MYPETSEKYIASCIQVFNVFFSCFGIITSIKEFVLQLACYEINFLWADYKRIEGDILCIKVLVWN